MKKATAFFLGILILTLTSCGNVTLPPTDQSTIPTKKLMVDLDGPYYTSSCAFANFENVAKARDLVLKTSEDVVDTAALAACFYDFYNVPSSVQKAQALAWFDNLSNVTVLVPVDSKGCLEDVRIKCNEQEDVAVQYTVTAPPSIAELTISCETLNTVSKETLASVQTADTTLIVDDTEIPFAKSDSSAVGAVSIDGYVVSVSCQSEYFAEASQLLGGEGAWEFVSLGEWLSQYHHVTFSSFDEIADFKNAMLSGDETWAAYYEQHQPYGLETKENAAKWYDAVNMLPVVDFTDSDWVLKEISCVYDTAEVTSVTLAYDAPHGPVSVFVYWLSNPVAYPYLYDIHTDSDYLAYNDKADREAIMVIFSDERIELREDSAPAFRCDVLDELTDSTASGHFFLDGAYRFERVTE